MPDRKDFAAAMAEWRAEQAADDAFLAATEPDGGGCLPTWEEACRKADAVQRHDPTLDRLHRLMDDKISLEQAYDEIFKGRAPNGAHKWTVEALVYGLREGIGALNPDRVRRLGELNGQQMEEVARRLRCFKPHIAAAWSEDDIDALIELWARRR